MVEWKGLPRIQAIGQNKLVGNLCSLPVTEIDCDETKKPTTDELCMIRGGYARNDQKRQILIGEMGQSMSESVSMNLCTSL